jgi:transcriptional regulator with XRE-family HTH domain
MVFTYGLTAAEISLKSGQDKVNFSNRALLALFDANMDQIRATMGSLMHCTHLSENLRLLSSYMASISDLARRLGINRSQINKYLAGSTYPRPALLRRICDHFGVEAHEILMPPSEFSELIRVRGVPRNQITHRIDQHVEILLRCSDSRLLGLQGTYFEYYASMSTPNRIICTLMTFEAQDGVLYYRRYERVGDPLRVCKKHYRYEGIALMLGDRVFLTDHECELRVELTQTVLYPDYSKLPTRMHGIKIGVSANRQRFPCAARVYIERTPAGSSVLTNLRRCGLYCHDSPVLPPPVRAAVDNGDSGPDLFLARGGE